MGLLPSIVGTAIAVKQVQSIGNIWLNAPVSSMIRITPVIGARTVAVKKAAIPATA